MVDAMSEFAIKTPLRKAIVTKDVFYDLAQRVYEFISEKWKMMKVKFMNVSKLHRDPWWVDSDSWQQKMPHDFMLPVWENPY